MGTITIPDSKRQIAVDETDPRQQAPDRSGYNNHPRQQAPDRSGRHGSWTASARSQWATRILDGERQIAVGTTDPPQKAPDRSGHDNDPRQQAPDRSGHNNDPRQQAPDRSGRNGSSTASARSLSLTFANTHPAHPGYSRFIESLEAKLDVKEKGLAEMMSKAPPPRTKRGPVLEGIDLLMAQILDHPCTAGGVDFSSSMLRTKLKDRYRDESKLANKIAESGGNPEAGRQRSCRAWG